MIKLKKPRSIGRVMSSRLTEACLLYLNRLGHFAYRSNNMGRQLPTGRWINPKGIRGVADITGVAKDGKALYCEVKFGKDRMSPFQTDFRQRVETRGGYFIEARSVDDVMEWHNKTFEGSGK
jgi:hypothetical protein